MITINEIHPILVHFPIVLWLTGEVIALIILLRGGDLSARQHWPMTSFYALLGGTLFAALAAVFGDMAAENAVAAGFQAGPIETHETFALITLSLFALHTILRFLAIWRHYPLTGRRAWLSELLGFIGIFLLVYTAYLGGGLVYHLGVNTAAAL